jgi:hypothetical protein
MDWDVAIARADVLSSRHKTAADLLFFYRAVVRFQKEIYHRVKAHPEGRRPEARHRMLSAFFPDFIQLVEKYGPPELRRAGGEVPGPAGLGADPPLLLDAVARAPRGAGAGDPAAVRAVPGRALARRGGRLATGSGSCPFCSRAPIVSVLNGQRRLICSLCSHEWVFSEKLCPGCHAEKIESLRHRSFPHLKAEACTSCGHYLKSVDLRKDAAAVPLVDEIASTELDKQARERGFVEAGGQRRRLAVSPRRRDHSKESGPARWAGPRQVLRTDGSAHRVSMLRDYGHAQSPVSSEPESLFVGSWNFALVGLLVAFGLDVVDVLGFCQHCSSSFSWSPGRPDRLDELGWLCSGSSFFSSGFFEPGRSMNFVGDLPDPKTLALAIRRHETTS